MKWAIFWLKYVWNFFFIRSILSDALCAATAEWIFLLFFFCLPLVSYFCIFSSNLRCFSVVSLDERRGWMCMHSGKNNIYECTFFSRSLFVSYVSHVMRWLLERMHNETQNKTKKKTTRQRETRRRKCEINEKKNTSTEFQILTQSRQTYCSIGDVVGAQSIFMYSFNPGFRGLI